ncbi:MAG: hypothetical protein R3Y33_02450 [Clostridia bacterium]
MATKISTINGITLVTMHSSPARVEFIAEIFERLSKHSINVDMISMSPTHAAVTELSFTISDNDLIETLKFIKEVKTDLGVKSIVSSVNHKISVFDPDMKNTPGVAAKVFSSVKASDADIRLITTSEVEISLLVSEADFDSMLVLLEKAFA